MIVKHKPRKPKKICESVNAIALRKRNKKTKK